MEYNSKTKFKLEDYLLLFCLLLQDAGTFGIFPLNISQILTLILFGVLIFKTFINKNRIKFTKNVFFILIYVGIITIVNKFDFDSIKSYIYFVLNFCTIFIYVYNCRDINKIKKIIYITAVILSVYGIVQYIGFKLNIRFLYDITLYGISTSAKLMGGNGVLRIYSLYTEPAHLSAILPAALYIGFTDSKDVTKKWQNIIILALIFLTKSILVYFSTLVFIVLYFFVEKKYKVKNIILYGTIIIALLIILILFDSFSIKNMFHKVYSVFNTDITSTSDLTGLAISSNFKIAISKLNDGFIFGTGMDSARIWYNSYIKKIYDRELLLYLNIDDCASLFIRIFSEFGIVGLIITLLFISIKSIQYIKNKKYEMLFFTILFILSGLRNGIYVNTLTSIAFMIIFTYKDNKEMQELKIYDEEKNKHNMIRKLYEYVSKLKKENKKRYRIIRKINKLIINIFYPVYHYFDSNIGIDENSEFVISLTSFPKRINTVWITINTLLNQKVKPYSVVLWLSKEQFPDEKLPKSLERLKRRGLKIVFVEDDLKPHKKYYYAFLKYPDKKVITVDDDIFYPNDLIENFAINTNKYPNTVLCNFAHKITFDKNGNIDKYGNWGNSTFEDNNYSVPIGCGGILYYPQMFDDELYNIDVIKSDCLYTDDLWLKVMELKSDIKCKNINDSDIYFYDNIFNKNSGLWKQNTKGLNRNDETIKKLCKRYKFINKKLKEEK